MVCAADLNANGNTADDGEIATCGAVAGGYHCPLGRVACTPQPNALSIPIQRE